MACCDVLQKPGVLIKTSPMVSAPRPASRRRPSGDRLASIHSFATGSAATHTFKRGIEIARDAFDDDHAFLQQDQLGPGLHVEDFGIGEELAEQVGHRDFFRRSPVNRLADGAHRLREFLDAVMRRHVAGFEMDGGSAIVIARDEAVQDFREKAALGQAQPAHDAEVDGDDLAAVVDEQIALVHVGMKEAVAHGVAKE